MDLIKGIQERRSIRKFKKQPILRSVIEEIIGAASFAPSWKNTQTARYIVVEDREKIEALATEACMAGFTFNINTIANASAVVLLTSVSGRSGYEKDGSFSTSKGNGWEMFDAGIAAQTFCLAAHEKGIGTVIMGYFDEEEIAKIIEIPKGQTISAVIPMGYPDIQPAVPVRKPASELVTFI